MYHLENLISEYLEWQGYMVRKNTKVGRRAKGGWEMELDIVGFHPNTGDLVHLEPSLDALSWEKRENRYGKKFEAGRKYILSDLFSWLPPETRLRQFAIFIRHPKGRDSLAGGTIISIDEFTAEVAGRIRKRGKMSTNAIPEQFALLRTLQLYISGYYSIKPDPLAGAVIVPPRIAESSE